MFEDDRLYRAGDPALRAIGAYFTLAQWRSKSTGPAYVRIGRRIFYRGRDLNEWLEKQTVRPTDPGTRVHR